MSDTSIEAVSLSREELYEQVWATPMTKLAPKYGLSDVGLKKLCHRYNIPTPPLGHWAKKEFGKADLQPPLPVDHEKADDRISLRFDPTPTPKKVHIEPQLPVTDADLLPLVLFELDPTNQIVVADHLHGSHPIVRRTKEAMEQVRSPGMYNLMGPSWKEGEAFLSVAVGKESISRAMRLMNALLKALEARGHKIETVPRRNDYGHQSPEVVCKMLGETAVFSLREKTRRIRTTVGEKKQDSYWRRDVRYEPKGEFELAINRRSYGGDIVWKDSKRKPLEAQLNRVIIDLLVWVERCRKQRIEAKRRAEEAAREAERQRELKRRKKIELARRQQYETLTARWEMSESLRAFADVVREEHIRRHGTIEPGSEMESWLQWAEGYAQAIDPLSEDQPLPNYSDANSLADEYRDTTDSPSAAGYFPQQRQPSSYWESMATQWWRRPRHPR